MSDRGERNLCLVIIIYLFSNADNAPAKRGLNATVRSPVVQFLPSNATSNATEFHPSRTVRSCRRGISSSSHKSSHFSAHSVDAPAAEVGAFGSMFVDVVWGESTATLTLSLSVFGLECELLT